MKITYFFRNIKCGYSIQHVFDSVIPEIEQTNEIEIIHVPSPNSMPWDVVKNAVFSFKNRNKNGINHITGHIHDCILGLWGCKTVVTFHDLVFIDNVKNPIKRFYKWLFWLYLPVKLADKITCISTQTKNNVLKYIKTDKLSVIYNPIDPTYKFSPKKFNKEKPVILHIGTGWNKNLLITIDSLKDISCHLRIVGLLDQEQINYLKKSNIDYSNVLDLTDQEIQNEYVNCDMVSFVSIYEGFGMPIIEGQMIGRPVVTSNIEPLLEVGKNAALFVDPKNVDEIKCAFIKIIQDDTFREDLIARGQENVRRFDSKIIASQYNDLYKQMLS